MRTHTKKSKASLPYTLFMNLVSLYQAALNGNKVMEPSYQNYVLQVLHFIH